MFAGCHSAGDPLRESADHGPRTRCGFSRNQRITRSDDFGEIFRTGKRSTGRLMTLWHRSAPCGETRLGAVAGRKTFRRSVDRNRVRRRLREAFRLHRHTFRKGYDIMLVARHSILQATAADVEKELCRLVAKAGLLNREEETPTS